MVLAFSCLVGSTLLSNSLFSTLVLLLTEGRIKDLRCLLGYASGGGGLGSHRRFEAIINAILAIDSELIGLAIQGNCAKAVALEARCGRVLHWVSPLRHQTGRQVSQHFLGWQEAKTLWEAQCWDRLDISILASDSSQGIRTYQLG